MKGFRYAILACAGLWLVALSSPPSFAAAKACDRACLKDMANRVLHSMTAHAPASVPLAAAYYATENLQPASISMMSLWRTVTEAGKPIEYAIDPVAGQVFFATTVGEHGSPSIVYGRLKVEDRLISELELYINRARGDAGFSFDPDGLSDLPITWTAPPAMRSRASREVLMNAGKAIFDAGLDSPQASPDCRLVELGKVVVEDPDVLATIVPAEAIKKLPASKGMIFVPCGGSNANKPTDPTARLAIVDEEQGIAVSFAVIQGAVFSYPVTKFVDSAFVPDSMAPPYRKYLEDVARRNPQQRPAPREMAATVAVVELDQIYDGKLQGKQLLMHVSGPGTRSPWLLK